jgi:2'-5' RNA ligase
MPDTTRTFIAIPVPEPQGENLLSLQAKLAPEVPGCRWTASLPFHVTLAFLGDVPNRDLNDLGQAVGSAVESFQPLELRLEGLGAFPSPGKPYVVWAGLTTPDKQRLQDLHKAVVRAAGRGGHGPRDSRFHPHVTLGRIKSGPHGGCDLTALIQQHQDWSAASFPVHEVVTFASVLGPGGATYTALHHAPLKGKTAGDPGAG